MPRQGRARRLRNPRNTMNTRISEEERPIRVVIVIDPTDPHRDWVHDDAEFWLGSRARSGWRVREDWDGCEVLTFEFDDPLDAINFHLRAESAERRGRLG